MEVTTNILLVCASGGAVSPNSEPLVCACLVPTPSSFTILAYHFYCFQSHFHSYFLLKSIEQWEMKMRQLRNC